MLLGALNHRYFNWALNHCSSCVCFLVKRIIEQSRDCAHVEPIEVQHKHKSTLTISCKLELGGFYLFLGEYLGSDELFPDSFYAHAGEEDK